MLLPRFFYIFSNLLKMWRNIFVLILMFLSTNYSIADTLQVSITRSSELNSSDPSYFFERLLILALDKTRASDGDYVLVYNNHGGGVARDRAMLIAGAGIDVMWATATKERQQQMLVVPVELLKNLNNYRILLINGEDQPQFNQVKTIADLKKFTLGSGDHWTDGMIFKDNGFNVSVTSNYPGLFKMLAARRFNFISRGLHEIGYDTQTYKNFGLVKEQSLLLKYDVPVQYCFFVKKGNISLADRIERGLKNAQQDGSFDKLFYQMPSFKEGEEALKNSRRLVLELRNTKAD